jgi:hypothetical protein
MLFFKSPKKVKCPSEGGVVQESQYMSVYFYNLIN